jgi:hypothetical protein
MAKRVTRNFKPFNLRQQLWLESRNLKLHYPLKKIAPKHEEPFKVQEVLGPLTYRLALPNRWQIHPIFHASLLTPYKENNIHGENFLKPPEMIEGEQEYEVELIIARRKWGNRTKYLAKWSGYPSLENLWELTANLQTTQELIHQYNS